MREWDVLYTTLGGTKYTKREKKTETKTITEAKLRQKCLYQSYMTIHEEKEHWKMQESREIKKE